MLGFRPLASDALAGHASAAPPAVQYMRPGSVISSGSWSFSAGASLVDPVDEAVADDADYDFSAWNPVNDTMELKYTAPTTIPTVTTGHIVRYRIRGNGVGGQLVLGLYRGATLIAGPWTHNNVSGAWTTYAQTLSGTEAAALQVDPTNIRLRPVAN